MASLIAVYLVLINAAGFTIMLVDKSRAKKRLWRIPEATILTVAIIGGSLGALIGMYTVRHKTKHPKFSIGLPVILSAQILLFLVLYS